jgi:DegV family protein with EDD domain
MATIKIVTDGTCDIPLELAREYDIEVVPLQVEVDGRLLRIGPDISEDSVYDLLHAGFDKVKLVGPSATVFEQLYRSYMGEYDFVYSIHLGGRLGGIHAAAAEARSRLPASTTRVELIDSRLAAMSLGSVVLAAARAYDEGVGPDELYRIVAERIRHTHAVFFVDTMEFLEHSPHLTLSGAVIGSMQRIKPLLILDEGEIVPYERTRTRAKAIEGLYTFVEDFPQVEDVIVHYATTPEDVEKLLEKLEPIFPRERVQIYRFGAAVAAHLGPGAMGVTVYEGIDES